MFCFPKETILGFRMFVIYYNSKYSSNMFYDWNFLEMVHPGSALMTDMFSYILCMFCLPKEHPNMFFLGIQNVCHLLQSKYSSDMFYNENCQKWYILDHHWWLVCFVCPKSIYICFFHTKILLQKLHFTRIFQLW